MRGLGCVRQGRAAFKEADGRDTRGRDSTDPMIDQAAGVHPTLVDIFVQIVKR